MSTADDIATDVGFSRDTARASNDAARLRGLRARVLEHPDDAKRDAWAWLRELQAPSEHARLPWLFAQGTAPEAPNGDCEGIVMNLQGSAWLVALDGLVRLGQLLGGIGWTGKSFDAAAGTGYNRLTASSRIAALVVMPTYRFRRVAGELLGFPFHHAIERSPVAPYTDVRAIRYDAPEHRNPLVLPRTRDELVEIVPNVYLGRALLREADTWRVVGYFGLRYPRTAGC